MPNRRPTEQRSLFGEILDWMLVPLLLLWPMSVALTWAVAQSIANQPYDRALGELARQVARQVTRPPEGAPAPVSLALAPAAASFQRADEIDTVSFQVLGTRGEFVGGDLMLPIPDDDERAPPGELRFRDAELNGEPVRVAYLWAELPGLPTQQAPLVQVAETLGKRSRLATEIIKGVILPQFLILPVAVLLIWMALARGIAPLNELQRRIRQRAAGDLSPIDERDAPEEVSPLVRAINDLLARLDQSFAGQKRFLADAAHQLKTPLAGLRMQAEMAQREIDLGQREPEALKRSLQQIALSSQRAAHMVNQLLAMARAEDRQRPDALERVDLAQLATATVLELVPRALESRIDLGYEGPQGHGVHVLGQAVLLGELIRNLVDNALLYTPRDGRVTVRVIGDPFGQVVVLQVEDSGPGIAMAERELVFQPFYRVLGSQVDGSGLGLAIVREIAQRHAAVISLEAAQPTGALFTLRFVAAAKAAEPPFDPNEVHPP